MWVGSAGPTPQNAWCSPHSLSDATTPPHQRTQRIARERGWSTAVLAERIGVNVKSFYNLDSATLLCRSEPCRGSTSSSARAGAYGNS